MIELEGTEEIGPRIIGQCTYVGQTTRLAEGPIITRKERKKRDSFLTLADSDMTSGSITRALDVAFVLIQQNHRD